MNNEFVKRVLRYRLKAEFYDAKLDETTFLQSYKFGAEALKKELSKNEIEEIHAIYPLIQNINDEQIEEIFDDVIDI